MYNCSCTRLISNAAAHRSAACRRIQLQSSKMCAMQATAHDQPAARQYAPQHATPSHNTGRPVADQGPNKEQGAKQAAVLTLLRPLLGQRGIQRLPLLLRQEGGRGAVRRVAGLPHAAAAGAERVDTCNWDEQGSSSGTGATAPATGPLARERAGDRRWRRPSCPPRMLCPTAGWARGLGWGSLVGCRRRANRGPGGLPHASHVSSRHAMRWSAAEQACGLSSLGPTRDGGLARACRPSPCMPSPLTDPASCCYCAATLSAAKSACLETVCSGCGSVRGLWLRAIGCIAC